MSRALVGIGMGAAVVLGPHAAWAEDSNLSPLALGFAATADTPMEALAESKTPKGVLAWGRNDSAQIDVPMAAKQGVSEISAGTNGGLALTDEGSVIAWGNNGPIPTHAMDRISAIAAGSAHSLALTEGGAVISWSSGVVQEDVPMAAMAGVIEIAAGEYFSLALKNDGSVIAWGLNYFGETDVPPAAAVGVTAISAGENHAMALKDDGSVIAWGLPRWGATTIPAAAASGITKIAAGGYHSMALKDDGSVVAWGDRGYGQTAVPAAARQDVISIAGGFSHSVALKSDGSVVAWGDNAYGQSIVPVGAVTDVTEISGGRYFTLALKSVPRFDVAPPPALAILNQPYSHEFTATDNSTFRISSGALPDGLTLSPHGLLSGIPTREQDVIFTILVTGSSFLTTETSPISIKTDVIPEFTSPPPPAKSQVNEYLYHKFTARGNSVTYALSSGSLPGGVTLDQYGQMIGAATASGTFSYVVTATSDGGLTIESSRYQIQVVEVISGSGIDADTTEPQAVAARGSAERLANTGVNNTTWIAFSVLLVVLGSIVAFTSHRRRDGFQ